MTVAFELDGQKFTALNGGPHFKFNEAVSLVSQLREPGRGGSLLDPPLRRRRRRAQQCGWLKDRYGLSWQVVPTQLPELLSDPNPDKARRAMEAMLKMKKIDLNALREAAGAA